MSWRIWISQDTRVKQKVISASFAYLNLVESKSWLPTFRHITESTHDNCLVPWRIRVPKCDVIEDEICEIMGFVKIFWKNNVQDSYSPKISKLGQIVSEILAQLCSDDSIQILLNLTWFLILLTEPNLEGFVWNRQSITGLISQWQFAPNC